MKWFLLLLVVVFAMGGCNTVAGVAEDMVAASRGAQRYMAEHQAYRPNARPYAREDAVAR